MLSKFTLREAGFQLASHSRRPPEEHGPIVSPPAWRGAALQDGSSIG